MENSLDLDNKQEDQKVRGFPTYYIPPRTPIAFPTYSSGSEDLQKNQGALVPYSAVTPPSGYETSASSKHMEVASITKNFVEQSPLAVQNKKEDEKVYYIPPRTPIAFPTYSSGSGDLEKNQRALVPYSAVTPPSGYETSGSSKPMEVASITKNFVEQSPLVVQNKKEDEKVPGFPTYYIPPRTPISFPTYSSGSEDLQKNQGALVPYFAVTSPSGYETSGSSKPMEVPSITKNFVEQSPLAVQNKKEDEKVPGFPTYYIPPRTPIAFPTYSSGSEDLQKNQGALLPYSAVTPPSGYETSGSSKPMEVASITKNFVEQSPLAVQNKKEDEKVPGFPTYYIPPRTPIGFPTYSSGSEDLKKNQGALLPYSAVASPSGYQTSGSPKAMDVPSITKNFVDQSPLAVQNKKEDEKVPGFPTYYIPPRTPIGFPTYSSGSEDLKKNQGALLPYSAVASPSGYQTSGSSKPMEVASITKNFVEQSPLAVQNKKEDEKVPGFPTYYIPPRTPIAFPTYSSGSEDLQKNQGAVLPYSAVAPPSGYQTSGSLKPMEVPSITKNFVEQSSLAVQPSNKTNMMVNYLPRDMAEDELADMFSTFGQLRRVKIVRDQRSGMSLGYGFVDFVSSCKANVAQIMLNGRKVRDKVLKVTYACPRGDDPRNNSLYVAQLPPGVNHFQIRELFETYGHVLDVNFLLNKATGEPRGVAFVRFGNRTSAEQAQMCLNRIIPKFSSQPIEVKFVRRKPPISNPDHADADQSYGPGGQLGQVGQDGPGEQDGKPSISKWPFIQNFEYKIQEGSPPQLVKRRTDEQKVEQQFEAKRPRGFVYDSD